MKKIILASSSPRRREIMEMTGFDFECEAPDLDEKLFPPDHPDKAVKNLAIQKAEFILKKHPDCIVIGSDTIVVLEGKVLGKPYTAMHASQMLYQLSGKTHQVMTGLAILSSRHRYADVSVSSVAFARLNEKEIQDYAASGEPLDKAGAYAIQGRGGRFVEAIHGDYYAIMGLPLNKVYEQLKASYLY